MKQKSGFTLIEMSIVLMIIAVVLGCGMVILTSSIQQTQFNQTVATMDAIEKALLDYSVARKRLPCPSDLTLTASSANYGVEGANMGSCTGGAPAANYKSAAGTAEGGIPTRSLQLPDSFMYDGWGRRLRYAVDTSYTNATGSNVSLPPPISGLCYASTSAITVNDSTGAARTTAGIYTIISHGANGHGGYTVNGITNNAGSTNTDEQTNCHCDATGVYSGSYTPTYVQKAPTSATSLNSFDDIVAFKEVWQMLTRNSYNTAPACIYVADTSNNKIQKYTPNTGSWAAAMTDSFSSPRGIYVDSSGNVWVADYTTKAIKKYTASTGVWSTFLSGLAQNVAGVYVDSSSNVWITNKSGTNVAKYTSGAVLSYTSPAAFSSPYGICGDSSGNIWVADSGNNQLQKYNGAAWSTLGSVGTTAGLFTTPEGVYVDVSSNLWVADTANHRIQKCTAGTDCTVSTNWTTWGNTPVPATGTANGQFSSPAGITGDAFGNIWVADTGNNRIQKYTARTGIWSIIANYDTNYGVAQAAIGAPQGIAIVGR